MIVRIDKENLPFFEALASDVRLDIINLLCGQPLNIKELAQQLDLSSPIVSMHVKKLEAAGLIKTEYVTRAGSKQKLCTPLPAEYRIAFNRTQPQERTMTSLWLPVGQYTDCQPTPTCGLADEHQPIGALDDPASFFDPQRTQARILWFAKGYVEYTLPNTPGEGQQLDGIELSAELSAEAPDYNDDWPSAIKLSINGRQACRFILAGDFGTKRGVFTPQWWRANQYGVLKCITINSQGIFVDGAKQGEQTIGDFDLTQRFCRIRLEVDNDCQCGGLTIYGRDFGNYNQDIGCRFYYTSGGGSREAGLLGKL